MKERAIPRDWINILLSSPPEPGQILLSSTLYIGTSTSSGVLAAESLRRRKMSCSRRERHQDLLFRGTQQFLAPIFLLLLAFVVGITSGQTSSEQQLQCYACGLPKVHPENDIIGSYGTGLGKKMYNHSCTEMFETMDGSSVDDRFLRTCPVGVKSCFGAIGVYDNSDSDPSNDIKVRFFGCSEAKYKHSYGCDKELQNVNIRDKSGKKTQVDIEVKLCFCSTNTCNHPESDLLTSTDAAGRIVSGNLVLAVLGVASAVAVRNNRRQWL